MKPQRAWEVAYSQLEIQWNRSNFNTWLKDATFLDFDEQKRVFVIGVPKSYIQENLTHRFYQNVRRVVSDSFGEKIELRFEVVKTDPKPDWPFPNAFDEPDDDLPLFNYMSRQGPPRYNGGTSPAFEHYTARPRLTDLPESELNPRFTFDRFIVNKANHMVYEAARAVAENPDGAYNPLTIYGGVGLGKTHLLQAIGNECKARNLNVLFVPSEAFTNDLVQSIRRKQQAMFREKYRSADVLIVDDVQFIAGKESTQEEFFHTFNALYTFNKQIVLASDRHPDELTTLEARLRSRFAGGLLIDVQPPEFETRVAIMEMWANERGAHIERRVLETIAERAPDNIRELEGAFLQVIAKTRFSAHREMSVERAQRTLKRLEQPRNHAQPLTIDRVVEATAEAFDLTPDVLLGKRRAKRISTARQLAMYLARELTDQPLTQIGAAFAGRTHSTVLHSCNKVADELDTDRQLQEQLRRIKRQLLGEA